MVKGVPKAFSACPYAGAVAGWGEALVKSRPAGEGPNHCWGSAAASKAPGHRGCLGSSEAHVQQEGLHSRGTWAGEGANLPWSAVGGHTPAQVLSEAPLCCAAGAAGAAGTTSPILRHAGTFSAQLQLRQNESPEKQPMARSLPVPQVTMGQREEMFLDHESSHPANQVLKYVRNNVLFKN